MKRLLITFATIICLLMPTASVAAYNPLSDACGSGGNASDSSACSKSSGTNGSASNNVVTKSIKKVSTIIAMIAGIAAVIIIIIGGFMYITSNGEAQKTASARSAILGAVIGLVIIVAAQSILLFVLSKVE